MNNCKGCKWENKAVLKCCNCSRAANDYYEPISPLTSSTEYPPEAEKKLYQVNSSLESDFNSKNNRFVVENQPKTEGVGEGQVAAHSAMGRKSEGAANSQSKTKLPKIITDIRVAHSPTGLAEVINKIIEYLKERE